MILQWGKYKGRDIAQVPDDYIQWLLGREQQMVRQLEAELARREMLKGGMPWAERIITSGLRRLAQEHHPDFGGDTETMQEINRAAEALRAAMKGQTNGRNRR